MAVPANTHKTYENIGRREELSDVIYNISPEETPFMSNCGRGEVDQTFYEHQQDSLTAPDNANAQLEGDDAVTDAVTPTVRVGNYTQILRKVAQVSGTNERVNKAGRKSEMAYQMAKKSAELKRDIESQLLQNVAANAGAAGTARRTGTLLGHIKTNVDKEGTGVNPVWTSVPTGTRTDGATRAFTEAILKNVVQLCWTSGANTDTLMVGGTQKQVVSGFSGIATKTLQQTSAKVTAIIGAADIYVSDFGIFSIVPNRFQRNRDAFFLDFEYLKIVYLRPFKTEDLAKTGDSIRKQLLVELGLRVGTEKALGLAADLA